MHRASFLGAAACALPLLAAACGGIAVVDLQHTTTTTEGQGGDTPTGTTTGQGGATSTTGTTSTTTGAGGQPANLCGGEIGAICAPDQWCDFEPSAACGGFDSLGVCKPKPIGCDDDCPGVCGCDGNFYCNACNAQQAGVDVSGTDTCLSAPDFYRAVNMFTGIPRFVILKASPQRNLCFRLVASIIPSPGQGIQGDGWAVENAEVTSDLLDCGFDPGWPPFPAGEVVPATNGMGELVVPPPGATACGVGIHAKLLFSGAPAWVPAIEPLDADDIPVDGGCGF